MSEIDNILKSAGFNKRGKDYYGNVDSDGNVINPEAREIHKDDLTVDIMVKLSKAGISFMDKKESNYIIVYAKETI